MNGYEDTECEKHFTPPDEGRLLTEKEIYKKWGEGALTVKEFAIWLRDAQDAKTASIVWGQGWREGINYSEKRMAIKLKMKDQGCQASIEALIEEIESHEEHYAGVDSYSCIKIGLWKRGKLKYDEWWKVLKATKKGEEG